MRANTSSRIQLWNELSREMRMNSLSSVWDTNPSTVNLLAYSKVSSNTEPSLCTCEMVNCFLGGGLPVFTFLLLIFLHVLMTKRCCSPMLVCFTSWANSNVNIFSAKNKENRKEKLKAQFILLRRTYAIAYHVTCGVPDVYCMCTAHWRGRRRRTINENWCTAYDVQATA